ncbi:hypothetical protein HSB1_14570 [Halogranum salarium B-1]|uniref:Uncharacterized protein n=1 Tax=Halogranum salarium B-1 TaxID=1210908 RepID=J3JHB8_9EURY|nr:hypothetical protein HSB1_14570 [Halogranum salarium B-1]
MIFVRGTKLCASVRGEEMRDEWTTDGWPSSERDWMRR